MDEKVLGEVKDIISNITKEESKAGIEEIKNEVKLWLKETEEAREKKVGSFADEVVAKRAKLNTYMKEFLGNIVNDDVNGLEKLSGMSRKELTTDVTGSPYGGYVCDKELSAEIRHLITQYGVARKEMTALQLSKNAYDANTLATDVIVYWVDEGSTLRSSEVVLGQKELKLKKLGAIVAITRELIEDGEIDLFSFISTRIAEKFAEYEDEAFFNGDGSSTYGSFTGLLIDAKVTDVNMVGSTFASVDADDLLDMQDALPAGALANAKYYMHRSIKNIIRKLKGTDGQYIYQEVSQTGPATIWGKPVIEVEVMPTTADTAPETSFILFGDLKKACILGYKGAISIDKFNAGVVRNVANNADINLITTDREAVRWIERVGYINLLPTAVVRLTTGAVSA